MPELLSFLSPGTVIFGEKRIYYLQVDRKTTDLAEICRNAIEESLNLEIGLMVLTAEELSNAMANAPDWWGDDPDSKHNAIFVMPPASTEEIINGIGDIKPTYEKVAVSNPIIFWSAGLATFSRTRWSQIVKTKYYKSVTIRNANTARKLLEMSQKE